MSRFFSPQSFAVRKTNYNKPKPNSTGKKWSRRLGQMTIITMEILAIFFTIIFAGLGGVAWRVAQAPLPLPWVATAISEQFSDAKIGRNLHLNAAILSYDDTRQMVALELHGLSFHDINSTVSLSFPEAKIRFGLFGFLLGNIFPRVIVVNDSEVTVGDPHALREVLAGKSSPKLGDAGGGDAAPQDDPLLDFKFSPQALFSQAFLLTLQRIELRDVRLRIGTHDLAGTDVHVPDLIAPITVPEISLVLRHEMSDYLQTESRRDAVASDAGRLIIRGVKPDYLGRFWPEYPFLAAIDMPLDFEFGYVLDRGFAKSGQGGITVTARMRGASGRIKWDQFKSKFMDIESLDAHLTWRSLPNGSKNRPYNDLIQQNPKDIAADNHLTVDKLTLVTPEKGPILTIKLDVLSHAPAKFGAPRLTDLVADLSINKLDMEQLDRYWPPLFAEKSRDWVVSNIHQANLSNLSFHLALNHQLSDQRAARQQRDIPQKLAQTGGKPRNSVVRPVSAISAENAAKAAPHPTNESLKIITANGQFDYNNMTINYVEGLPYITDLSGTARFDTERFDFTVDGGRCANLALRQGGAVSFTGLNTPVTMLTVFLNLAGGKGDFGGQKMGMGGGTGKVNAVAPSTSGLSAALHILDSPPLALLKDTTLSEKSDRGAADIQLTLSMPLLETIPDDQIKFNASVDLEEAELVNILNGWSFTHARAHIEADNEKLSLNGEGLFENIPTKIQWVEYFKPTVAQRRVVRAEARLDSANAAHLKIPLYGKLAAPIPISLDYKEDQFSTGSLTVHFDATPAEYVMTFPHAVKNAGEVALGAINLQIKNGAVSGVSQAKIVGPKMDIDLVGEFNADGTQTALYFNQFRFGENDFTGAIKFSAEKTGDADTDIREAADNLPDNLSDLSGQNIA
ncbi:MAG: hypothetical protein ORN98_11440, partial [Alphaproteobacteria bacterium]|nr:hypothetical protein [Alphaproteobacteria bacterium]